jgi:hypothetical protein
LDDAVQEMLDTAGQRLGELIAVLIAAIASAVPVSMREGMTRTQAFIMCIAGTAGAWSFGPVVSRWIIHLYPELGDIRYAVVFLLGITIMRVVEQCFRIATRLIDHLAWRYLGIEPTKPRRRHDDEKPLDNTG